MKKKEESWFPNHSGDCISHSFPVTLNSIIIFVVTALCSVQQSSSCFQSINKRHFNIFHLLSELYGFFLKQILSSKLLCLDGVEVGVWGIFLLSKGFLCLRLSKIPVNCILRNSCLGIICTPFKLCKLLNYSYCKFCVSAVVQWLL